MTDSGSKWPIQEHHISRHSMILLSTEVQNPKGHCQGTENVVTFRLCMDYNSEQNGVDGGENDKL